MLTPVLFVKLKMGMHDIVNSRSAILLLCIYLFQVSST